MRVVVKGEALVIARHGVARARCKVLKSRPEVEPLGRTNAQHAVLWRPVGQARVHDVGRIRGDPITGHGSDPDVDRVLTLRIEHGVRPVRVASAFGMDACLVLQQADVDDPARLVTVSGMYAQQFAVIIAAQGLPADRCAPCAHECEAVTFVEKGAQCPERERHPANDHDPGLELIGEHLVHVRTLPRSADEHADPVDAIAVDRRSLKSDTLNAERFVVAASVRCSEGTVRRLE